MSNVRNISQTMCDFNHETAVHDFKLQTAYLSCNYSMVALEAE